MTQPIRLQSLPGIKRDGTKFEGEHYIDGQWCRFQRGRPRKMGGYQSVAGDIPERVRGMSAFSEDGLNFLHLGQQSTLQQYNVNNNGNLVSTFDRTPAALAVSVNNLWQFTTFFEAVGPSNRIMAHAGQNLTDIDSSVETPIFFGTVSDSAILTDTGVRSVSGGVVALGVYLFSFGNDGQIGFSGINDPTTVSDSFITPQKIVRGLPLRGAGTGPAGIFWSLDSIIRATFVGTPVFWQFDTLSSESSILSSQSVIEYDGIFYWMGVDRMLMFNGVVRDIPNAQNINWFFDNLNFTERQKVFAYKVPRFGEIWWCYPRDNATECTHAIIYNVREDSWYDTELPDSGRTAGIYAKTYRKPFMADNDLTATSEFSLWQHETGVDKIEMSNINAIPSHFETAEISLLTNEQAMDKSLHVARIEPDFVQSEDMTVSVRGRANARAPVVQGETFTFNDAATDGDEETIKLRDVRRLMSFKFESNQVAGDYEMGETIAHIAPADGRVES